MCKAVKLTRPHEDSPIPRNLGRGLQPYRDRILSAHGSISFERRDAQLAFKSPKRAQSGSCGTIGINGISVKITRIDHCVVHYDRVIFGPYIDVCGYMAKSDPGHVKQFKLRCCFIVKVQGLAKPIAAKHFVLPNCHAADLAAAIKPCRLDHATCGEKLLHLIKLNSIESSRCNRQRTLGHLYFIAVVKRSIAKYYTALFGCDIAHLESRTRILDRGNFFIAKRSVHAILKNTHLKHAGLPILKFLNTCAGHVKKFDTALARENRVVLNLGSSHQKSALLSVYS